MYMLLQVCNLFHTYFRPLRADLSVHVYSTFAHFRIKNHPWIFQQATVRHDAITPDCRI